MFELNEDDINQMVTHNVIPSQSYFGGAKPFAFTEQGVAMLSSVLECKTAIEVNIQIMRVFVSAREFALNHIDLSERIKELEMKFNKQFEDVFDALNYLVNIEATSPNPSSRRGTRLVFIN